MKNLKIAIVGATGLVGRSFLKVLEEKKLPIESYTLFASKHSAGEKIHFLGKDYIIQELKEDSFDSGFDYALFSAGGDVSKKFAPIAASKGCIVIDNSSYFRMFDDVPLVVPEVNFDDVWNNHGIIANPNCSTIQAMLPLKALNDKYKIKRIVYSTYQAVSGAGKLALDDLDNLEYRKEMLMGSFFAGLAFSNTRTTACHSISYPLTMLFNINHGFAAALTLFEVLDRNWDYLKEKDLFLESWDANDLDDIKIWFDDVSDNSLRLSNFGVKREDIPDIVKLATTGGRMDNNPIIFNEKEIHDILNSVF